MEETKKQVKIEELFNDILKAMLILDTRIEKLEKTALTLPGYKND